MDEARYVAQTASEMVLWQHVSKIFWAEKLQHFQEGNPLELVYFWPLSQLVEKAKEQLLEQEWRQLQTWRLHL